MQKQEEAKSFFELEYYRMRLEKNKDFPGISSVTIKISVNGDTEITADEGVGPVYALDNALRKALSKFYKTDLDSMRLINYNVHVIGGNSGTASKVRVSIESGDEYEHWTTIGISEDVIEASWQALSDSFRRKLAKNGQN